jgi:hypothetical protein
MGFQLSLDGETSEEEFRSCSRYLFLAENDLDYPVCLKFNAVLSQVGGNS